jgi:alpha-glucosidase
MNIRRVGVAMGVVFSFVAATFAQDPSLRQQEALAGPRDVVLKSPNGNIQVTLAGSRPRARLSQLPRTTFSITFRGATVLEKCPMVFTLDGVDLTSAVQSLGDPETYRIEESFPARGASSSASVSGNGAKVPLRHGPTSRPFTVELRAYNDGVAFRTIVPSESDAKHAPDERTVFVIPEGSTVWHHDLAGHYESPYKVNPVSEIPAAQWLAPPLTFKLPGSGGYASISEANLVNYSGMAFESDGRRGLVLGLAHRQPVNWPYELRYSREDVARLSQPAVIAGTITTPWRIIMIGADLNAMVNNQIIAHCSDPPDPKLFPKGYDTDWLKPGRGVWRYTDGGENRDDRIQEVKTFSELAGRLGFEYNVVEGFWRNFSDEQLRDVVKHAADNNVKLIVWHHSNRLRTLEAMDQFFRRLHDFGIAGAKIDFFDHEHKETIDQYQMILRKAAEYKIVLDFHGANKPAGETRTWPNEFTREAVRGMEASRFTERALLETTLPFTRYLAGHAEYTVVHFGARRGDTTVAHQIATAAVFYAPLLTYSLHPQKALESPAVEMIRAIPAIWDETIVLPPSEIGELAVFARRRGNDWFLVVLNGPQKKSVQIPLKFLKDGQYRAMVVKDRDDGSASTTQPTAGMSVENATMSGNDVVNLDLMAGGGYIAKFSR